jgi:hypothetical protein
VNVDAGVVAALARRTVAWFVVAVFVLGHAQAARAQATDRALAEELFREAQSLMGAQRYDEACPKLQESQRLDPATGTLLNLAVCHEKQGRLASAWTEYSEVVTLARRDNRPDRVSYAERRLAAIEPKLSRLRLELAPGVSTTDLTIRLDGADVGLPSLGVAVPVDPGKHDVSASAPGKRPWTTSIEVASRPAQQTVVIPALADAPDQGTAPARSAPHLLVPPGPAAADRRPGRWLTSRRIVGLGIGGLGLVGVGVGSYFGLRAISKNDDSNQEGCEGNQCTEDAAAIRNDAISAGDTSTIAFIVGGAALGAGLVLVFTDIGSSTHARAPVTRARLAATERGGSLQLEGAW